MGDLRSGALVKLSIEAYEDPGFNTLWEDGPNPIKVQINPASYAQEVGVCFTEDAAIGGTGNAKIYNRTLGNSLSLELVFDGTGAVHDRDTRTVEQRIEEVRRMAIRTNGNVHEPNYLILTWGTLHFRGRLQSLHIDYTLFHPDGSPLRAKAKAKFVGFHENREAKAAQNNSSPDLTHLRIVGAGDTLPLMCHRIYGDSGYYVKVAEANGLDGFRALPVGTALLFPPLSGPRR
jgi:hypothetical protein